MCGKKAKSQVSCLFHEDPFALKRNVARSLNSQMVFEYVQERFRTAYKYFACPQKKGRMEEKSKLAGKQGSKLSRVEKKGPASMCANKVETNLSKLTDENIQMTFQQSKDDDEILSDNKARSDLFTEEDVRLLDGSLMAMALIEENKASEHSSLPINGLLHEEIKGEEEETCFSEKVGVATSEELHYIFDKMIFTGGKVIMTQTLIQLFVCFPQ